MKNLPGAQMMTHVIWACFVSDVAGPSPSLWPLFLLFVRSPLCSHFPSSSCVLVVIPIIGPVPIVPGIVSVIPDIQMVGVAVVFFIVVGIIVFSRLSLLVGRSSSVSRCGCVGLVVALL
jgi:hypothetical protein